MNLSIVILIIIHPNTVNLNTNPNAYSTDPV